METCWPALESLGYQTDINEPWQPKLAESWDIDYDALTVTLHLKQGITFHNGDPFNADDVVFTALLVDGLAHRLVGEGGAGIQRDGDDILLLSSDGRRHYGLKTVVPQHRGGNLWGVLPQL